MMSLRDWFEHCADLWKGRKKVDLNVKADELDSALGPWSEGSRRDAVAHVEKLGRMASFKGKDAHPSSPEGQAYRFMQDMVKVARRKTVSRPVLSGEDTLEGPLDSKTLKHHAERWASHNDRLEHVPRGSEIDFGDGSARVLKPQSRAEARPVQFRTNTVSQRIKHMTGRGVKDLYASDDDLATIHTGVERAIAAGKVSPKSANRYSVMREAIKLNRERHKESYPGLDFKPSYASFDTESLRVMSAGIEHLHETGFSEAKSRLAPTLSSAVESHSVHPHSSRQGSIRRRATTTPYPNLHPFGSIEFKKQEQGILNEQRVVDRRRAGKAAQLMKPAAAPKAPKSSTPAAAEAPSWKAPASWDEYKTRSEAGEDFETRFKADPKLRSQIEGMNPRRQRVLKSLDGTALFNLWKAWRTEGQ